MKEWGDADDRSALPSMRPAIGGRNGPLLLLESLPERRLLMSHLSLFDAMKAAGIDPESAPMHRMQTHVIPHLQDRLIDEAMRQTGPVRVLLLEAVEAFSIAPAHDSDCATNNEPAYPNGPCDCSSNEGAG
tara:strand:- start:1050 stop:1442 length:393 start_codon:yes stop_codon:yes gene_type:complete